VKEAPRILVDSPVVRVATWREVFAATWHTAGAAADVRGANAVQRAFSQRLGRDERMITLSIVGPGASVLLDGDVRREVEAGTREFTPRLKAAAVVIAATGFSAAAIRSIVSAIVLLNRPAYPTRVFDGEDAACKWAATFLTRAPASPVYESDLREALHAIASPPR
jgi:hypothetical protein